MSAVSETCSMAPGSARDPESCGFRTCAALSLLGGVLLVVPACVLSLVKDSDVKVDEIGTVSTVGLAYEALMVAPVILWLAAVSCACFDEVSADRFRCNTRWVSFMLCLMAGVAMIIPAGAAVYFFDFAIPSSIQQLQDSEAKPQSPKKVVGEILGDFFLAYEEALAFIAAVGFSILACACFGAARCLVPEREIREAPFLESAEAVEDGMAPE